MTIRKMIYIASKSGDTVAATTQAFADFWEHADWHGEYADGKYCNMTIFKDWLIIDYQAAKTVTFIDKAGDLIEFEKTLGGRYEDIRFTRLVMHNGRIFTQLH